MAQFRLVRSHDPSGFIDATSDFLYSHEARYSLLLGLAENLSQRLSAHRVPPFLIHLENDGLVKGVCLRSDPARLVVSTWPPEALPLLQAELIKLKPKPRTLIGPSATLGALMQKKMQDKNLNIKLTMEQKILKSSEITAPKPCRGSVRLADANDTGVVTRWILDFIAEATPEAPLEASEARSLVEKKIARQQVYVWCVDGRVVCMAHIGRPTKNGASISAVYTPKSSRRRGYASNLVAEVSRRLLRSHHFCVLYTDAANPTSNKIYQAIGYEIIGDSQMYSFGV